ncbi:Adenylate kinase [Rhizobiales bacterium GAS191]|jgi:adenylate kinase family enzyme|nr:Adenylate kinase [Rhizobiales bacterium GAS113]SED76677.1 Adenylate kinase [Rhizobiales bacterium GAS188]SEE67783.1 Adenylate kinase [Rhizobiales bacterium GAS191]
MARLHILGASGSGTSTLGKTLATALGYAHEDTDAYYWMPSDPPFATPRPREARLALLQPRLSASKDWILSGSAVGWGKPLEPLFDLIVFLRLDPEIRMERLRRREFARYGNRIGPGGDMAAASREFLDWAGSYDRAGVEQRSLAMHERWLATQRCPVLRLDTAHPANELVEPVLEAIAAIG